MKKVVVFSHEMNEVSELAKTLEAHLPYKVEATSLNHKFDDVLSKEATHLVVVNQSKLVDDHEEIIQNVRRMGLQVPILFALESIPKVDMGPLAKRVHYLLKPFQPMELTGIVKKLIHTKEIPQQNFKRYNTDERALLEGLNSGIEWTSSLYNLSQGGAYCEYDIVEDSSAQMSIGDLFRLKVNLDNVSTMHTLNARLVWKTRKGKYSGRQGIGLQFVNSEEIYRQLLDRI